MDRSADTSRTSWSSLDARLHSDSKKALNVDIKPPRLSQDKAFSTHPVNHVAVIPVMSSDVEKGGFQNETEAETDEGMVRPGSGSGSSESTGAKDSGNGRVIVDEKGNPGGSEPELTWPDGGLKAWGNILGCTLISVTAFGQVNSFGVFQSHYASNQLRTNSSSEISWIGSVQITLLYVSGLCLGRVLDIYGARGLLISGCLLSTFSCCMLSLSSNYYQIFLSQGVGLGLGVALQFYPLLVIPSHWFRRRRAAAVGIVIGGSSLGGILFPIMLSRLFDSIGFAWAVRVMALLIFSLQAVSIPLIRERLPPSKNKKVIDLGAFRDVRFALHCASGFFSAFGIFTPFWYITLFMLNRGSSESLAFYSIAVMNGAGLVGRVVGGYVADRVGRYNTLVVLAFLQAVSVLAVWTTSTTLAETLVFAVLFGCSSASYLSVASSCVASITPDPSQIGTRTGMFTASMAPGVLAGPPIAGALIALRSTGSSSHSVDGATGDLRFLWAQFFGGAMLAVGAILALLARIAVRRSFGKA